ncbi:hypothetical protein BKA62DRAFT_699339 [Auriculariales sp. MPI-PUGE-AT-0066]|nr:hypothetical protein BKA62DRAFT_699339 [Auriculariales sp. MPI-PUGE-AT-0066]
MRPCAKLLAQTTTAFKAKKYAVPDWKQKQRAVAAGWSQKGVVARQTRFAIQTLHGLHNEQFTLPKLRPEHDAIPRLVRAKHLSAESELRRALLVLRAGMSLHLSPIDVQPSVRGLEELQELAYKRRVRLEHVKARLEIRTRVREIRTRLEQQEHLRLIRGELRRRRADRARPKIYLPAPRFPMSIVNRDNIKPRPPRLETTSILTARRRAHDQFVAAVSQSNSSPTALLDLAEENFERLAAEGEKFIHPPPASIATSPVRKHVHPTSPAWLKPKKPQPKSRSDTEDILVEPEEPPAQQPAHEIAEGLYSMYWLGMRLIKAATRSRDLQQGGHLQERYETVKQTQISLKNGIIREIAHRLKWRDRQLRWELRRQFYAENNMRLPTSEDQQVEPLRMAASSGLFSSPQPSHAAHPPVAAATSPSPEAPAISSLDYNSDDNDDRPSEVSMYLYPSFHASGGLASRQIRRQRGGTHPPLPWGGACRLKGWWWLPIYAQPGQPRQSLRVLADFIPAGPLRPGDMALRRLVRACTASQAIGIMVMTRAPRRAALKTLKHTPTPMLIIHLPDPRAPPRADEPRRVQGDGGELDAPFLVGSYYANGAVQELFGDRMEVRWERMAGWSVDSDGEEQVYASKVFGSFGAGLCGAPRVWWDGKALPPKQSDRNKDSLAERLRKRQEETKGVAEARDKNGEDALKEDEMESDVKPPLQRKKTTNQSKPRRKG